MSFILNLFLTTLGQVWHTLSVNWPFLLISVILSAVLKLYIDPKRASAFLMRNRKGGVIGATAIAVTTPLCSCGTTAVVLGMMANLMPWSPIVAFMVASPLTSPEELIYSAGLFGWRFAIAFFVASILLGLAGGIAAGIMESRGWLANQTRLAPPTDETVAIEQPACDCQAVEEHPAKAPFDWLKMRREEQRAASLVLIPVSAVAGSSPALPFQDLSAACGCSSVPVQNSSPCGGNENRGTVSTPGCDCTSKAIPACACEQTETNNGSRRVDFRQILLETIQTGKRLLTMFLVFAFVGYFLNGLIPQAWVAAVFGSGKAYSVPLAATLGVPFYVNTEASLPLVRTLMDAGMSQGAALAFLITGAGTSLGAVAGALTIARWRVIALVIGTLWVGAIILGFAYDLFL